MKVKKHHRWRKILALKFTTLVIFGIAFLFVGAAFAKAPIVNDVINRFIKPQALTQSSTTLSQDTQLAIEDLADREIKDEQAHSVLPEIAGHTLAPKNEGLNPVTDDLQVTLAPNPRDRAKARIRKIDRLAVRLEKFLDNKSDKAIAEAIATIQKIGEETDKLVTDKNLAGDREILALQIAQYNRLQLVIQHLEDELPMATLLKIESARKKYLVVTATSSINAAPNLDAVHNIAVREVAKIVGDDFSELKAMEIIADFEAGIKPEARKKLTGLEKELAITLEKKMLKLPRDARNRKLQDYIQYSFGDPLLQIRSIERMKNNMSDREIILGLDSLKELAMAKLINRIFELESQEDINTFLDSVIQSPEDLKILAEIQLAVNSGRDEGRKQKLAQMTKSVEGKVTQFFASGDLESYFASGTGRPTDVLDVLLISNLSTIVSTTSSAPTGLKQKFSNLKSGAVSRFVAEISSGDFVTKSKLAYNPVSGGADVRVLLSSPQGLGLLQQVKKEAGESEKGKLDIAIRAQSAILQDHILTQVQDPEIFEDYQSFIDKNSQVKQTLQAYAGEKFFSNLSKKSEAIRKTANENRQKKFEVMQQIIQSMFISKSQTNFEKQLPDKAREQIAQLKKQLPAKNIPQMTLPEGVSLPKIAKLSSSIEQAILLAAKQRIKDKEQSSEVKIDLAVKAKDLGVAEPRILPGNPLYFVKRLARLAQLALTFDPLQRAEVLIQQDNQKTLEAVKLLEKSSSRKTIELALNTLADVQKDFGKLKENSVKLDQLRHDHPEKVDQLVNLIIKNGLARQAVFSSIEGKVYGADYVRVEKIRQSVLKDGVGSLLELTGGDAASLVKKLELAVNSGSGSKFKELKAIELLTEIKRFEPEKIGKILEGSEIRLVKQFEAHLLEIDKKERETELLTYAESLPGNPVRQFEAYEQLKDSFTNKETLFLTDALKDKAVENLRDQVSEISDTETLHEFVTEVVGNKPEDLKIITEIELRVETPQVAGEVATPIEQKIEDIKTEVEQNIVEEVIHDPASLAQSDLFSNLGHSTDVVDVIVTHELENVLESAPEVTPSVVETVQNLVEETTNHFIENVTSSTQTESQQALEPVPQIIAELVQLKEEMPASVDTQIDIAIAAQVNLIEEYLNTEVSDPATFETYLAQIEENPVVAQTVAQVGGTEFTQALEQTIEQINTTAQSEQTLLEETVATVEQEVFSNTTSGAAIVETLPQSVQEEIQQVKQEIPAAQIPQVQIEVTVVVNPEPSPTPVSAPAPIIDTAPPPEIQSAPAPAAPAAPGL